MAAQSLNYRSGNFTICHTLPVILHRKAKIIRRRGRKGIMKILLTVIALLSVSCGKHEYLTVEETVRQCKVCENSGLFSSINTSWNDKHVISVTCTNYRFKSSLPDYAKIKKAPQDSGTVQN
jgi:hypothetical protein